MKPDNTPEAITPEEKAKKLGISVEQFRKLEPGLADAKLKGKFPKCGLHGNEGCLHGRNAPCFWSKTKRTPLLNFTERLPDSIAKKSEEVKGERLLMLLGNEETTLQFASNLHKERLRQEMKAKNNPLAEGLDMVHMLPCVSANFYLIDCSGSTLTDVGLGDAGKELEYTFLFKDLVNDNMGSIPVDIPKLSGTYTIFLQDVRLDGGKYTDKFFSYALPALITNEPSGDLLKRTNGFLIISSICKKNDIPAYISKRFKIIELEPEQSKTVDKLLYNWSINDGQEVFSNGKSVAKLPRLQFKIFNTLKEKVGKFVKRKTLEACWATRPRYESFVTDAINGLETLLERGLRNKRNIIERKKNGKSITAYKLPP